MEETKKIQDEKDQVTIYCNNCKKELLKTIPCDDGYFDNPFRIDSTYYRVEAHMGKKFARIEPKYSDQDLCEECKEKLIDNIKISLNNIRETFKEFNIEMKD